jgi:hypothetical protein
MLTKKIYQFLVLLFLVAIATGIFAPTSVNDATCHPLDLACTDYIKQISQVRPPDNDRAWGETGAAMLPLAAQVMSVRNPTAGESLNPVQKQYLRPFFGDLVDRVKITYRATLLDRWEHQGQATHIGGVNSIAQTYCDRIYLRPANDPNSTDRLVLLAHELTHSRQCQQAGGLSKFGSVYFRGYFQGGKVYANNPLEKSARAVEAKFARTLCRQIGCPRPAERYYVNYKGLGLSLPVKITANS